MLDFERELSKAVQRFWSVRSKQKTVKAARAGRKMQANEVPLLAESMPTGAITGKKGRYKEPSEELSIKNFAISLHSRAAAFAKMGAELKVLEGNNGK